jgi:hypothetical protein
MILIQTCWYLTAVFVALLALASVITVVPDKESIVATVMVAQLVLAVASGSIALLLQRQFRKKPNVRIFRAKVVAGVAIGLAILVTLVCLLAILA